MILIIIDDNTFQKALSHSLLGQVKMNTLMQLALTCMSLPGAFAELGVYKGGSSYLLREMDRNRELVLFDTFEGMPFQGDGDLHQCGDFGDTSLEAVQQLVGVNERTFYMQGIFPDTASKLPGNAQYAFVHLDADQYQSTFDALKYFYPLLPDGGIILLDDYEWKHCPGVKRAMVDYIGYSLSEYGSNVVMRPLGNNQAMFQKPKELQL